MNRTRVYAPETNEPFDVTPSKAGELILLKGWTKTPVTRTSVVENTLIVDDIDLHADEPAEALDDANDEDATWRGGRVRARGRKTSGSEDVAV